MKITHELLEYKDLKIVQDPEMFSFSLDSVLLPNFVTLNPSIKQILDIGTGNAPIPLILSKKTKAHITAIEIQEESYKMAKESVKINKLDDQITIINEDINKIDFKPETFDVITCNPPYFEVKQNSKINKNDYKTIARHEIKLTLEQILKISRKILKNGGVISLVHRPERMIDILEIMRKYNIEPKKIRLVYPKTNREANILLIEGMKNGKKGLKILPPLYSHTENGSYTEEIKKFFK